MTIRIRPETSADCETIRDLTTRAFASAAHSSGTEAEIVETLRRRGQLAYSAVAEAATGVVGHVALSPVSMSDSAPGWFGLGPLSVVPEYQGQGIGSRLVREALAWLEKRKAAGCVLVGEPEYYARFGFRAYPELMLPGVPPQYLLAIPFGGAIPGGAVRFDDSFGVVSE